MMPSGTSMETALKGAVNLHIFVPGAALAGGLFSLFIYRRADSVSI